MGSLIIIETSELAQEITSGIATLRVLPPPGADIIILFVSLASTYAVLPSDMIGIPADLLSLLKSTLTVASIISSGLEYLVSCVYIYEFAIIIPPKHETQSYAFQTS